MADGSFSAGNNPSSAIEESAYALQQSIQALQEQAAQVHRRFSTIREEIEELQTSSRLPHGSLIDFLQEKEQATKTVQGHLEELHNTIRAIVEDPTERNISEAAGDLQRDLSLLDAAVEETRSRFSQLISHAEQHPSARDAEELKGIYRDLQSPLYSAQNTYHELSSVAQRNITEFEEELQQKASISPTEEPPSENPSPEEVLKDTPSADTKSSTKEQETTQVSPTPQEPPKTFEELLQTHPEPSSPKERAAREAKNPFLEPVRPAQETPEERVQESERDLPTEEQVPTEQEPLPAETSQRVADVVREAIAQEEAASASPETEEESPKNPPAQDRKVRPIRIVPPVTAPATAPDLEPAKSDAPNPPPPVAEEPQEVSAVAQAIEDAQEAQEQQAVVAVEPVAAPSATAQAATAPVILPTNSIQEERERLRTTTKQALRNRRIIKAYDERLEAQALRVMQERYPQQEAAWRSARADVGVQADAFAMLPPEARLEVHLQAVIDVRAAFPDVTEASLTALLADETDKLAQKMLTNTLALGAAVGASTAAVTSAAHLAAGQAILQIAKQALSQVEGARGSEQVFTQRSTRLQQALSPAGEPVDEQEAEQARASQQRAAAQRPVHQAALRASLGQLRTLASGAQLATNPAQKPSPEVAAVILGQALQLGAPGFQPTLPPSQTSAEPQTSEADFHAKQASLLRSAQARSMMQRLPTTRGSSSSRTSSPESSSQASSGQQAQAGAEQEPLLAIRHEEDTPNANFSRSQRRMTRTQAQFLGGVHGPGAGGYEALFGVAAGVGAQDGDASSAGGSLIDAEPSIVIEDEEGFAQDEARAQALAEAQQASRQEEALENEDPASEEGTPSGGLRQKADTIQKIAKNPHIKKLAAGVGGVAAVVLVIVVVILVIIWLNIRLIAPKEGSLLRKPLTGLGIFGTILLDITTVVFAALSLVLTIGILLIPLLPIIAVVGTVTSALQ